MPTSPIKKNGGGRSPGIIQPLALLGGLGITLAALGCGSVLVGAVVFITDIQVNLIPLLRIFACLSLFVGGIYGGLKAERAGWLHGALVGLIYFFVLSRFGGGNQVVMGALWVGRGVLCVVASTLGGIIGVNLQGT